MPSAALGADRGRLEALAASLGVSQAAVFLGRVSDAEKAALLAAADVYAMPVRREGPSVEGFGIGYVEAAWFGVPSLAGRDGGAARCRARRARRAWSATAPIRTRSQAACSRCSAMRR